METRNVQIDLTRAAEFIAKLKKEGKTSELDVAIQAMYALLGDSMMTMRIGIISEKILEE